MTVDDLIKLMEAFVGHLTVKDLRQGGDTNSVTELEDEEYATLVKFLAGERPEAGVRFRQDGNTLTNIDPIHIDASHLYEELPKTVEENGKTRRMTAGERWRAANPLVGSDHRDDPDKPLTLKGEFDGVQLP